MHRFIVLSIAANEGWMTAENQPMPAAKRKRLLKTYGPGPAGYTHDDLERLLDFLCGMYSGLYTTAELRTIVVNHPFDRSEQPQQMKLLDLVDWLECLLTDEHNS